MWDFRSHSVPHNYPHSWHTEHRVAHIYHSVVCIELCVNPVFKVLSHCGIFRSFIYHIIPTDLAYWTHIDVCLPQCGIYWTMCKPCVQSVVTLWGFRSFIYHIIPTDLAYWTHSDLCLPQCGIYWTMCKPCVQSVVTLWDFRSLIYHIIPTDLAYWTHNDLCLPHILAYFT